MNYWKEAWLADDLLTKTITYELYTVEIKLNGQA